MIVIFLGKILPKVSFSFCFSCCIACISGADGELIGGAPGKAGPPGLPGSAGQDGARGPPGYPVSTHIISRYFSYFLHIERRQKKNIILIWIMLIPLGMFISISRVTFVNTVSEH